MRRWVCALSLLIAAPPPGAGAQANSVKMEFDVRIPMKDGVTLSTDIFRPDTTGQFPVSSSAPPTTTAPVPTSSVANGGRRTATSSRSRTCAAEATPREVLSPGHRGRRWRRHGHLACAAALVQWEGGAPPGASYLGWVQGYLAGMRNPHLAAMVMMVTPPDPDRNWPVQFGAYGLTTISWLAQLSGHTQQNISELDLASIYKYRPFREMDLPTGRIIQAWRDWWDHPTRDDYWKQQAYQENLLDTEVPILHLSGWYDDVMIGTMENWGTSPLARPTPTNGIANGW